MIPDLFHELCLNEPRNVNFLVAREEKIGYVHEKTIRMNLTHLAI